MPSLPLRVPAKPPLTLLTAFTQAAQVRGAPLAFGELAGGRTTRPVRAGCAVRLFAHSHRRGKTLLAARHRGAAAGGHWRASDAPGGSVAGAQRDDTRADAHGVANAGLTRIASRWPMPMAMRCAWWRFDELAQIALPDWGRAAVVVVATIQSFRASTTPTSATCYSFSERFERHFKAAESAAA